MVIVNDPLTLPLKFPPKLNPPLSVGFAPKHGLDVVNLKFEMISPSLPLDVNAVVKLKTGLPFVSSKVAVQLPLIELFVLLPFEVPQAARSAASASNPT